MPAWIRRTLLSLATVLIAAPATGEAAEIHVEEYEFVLFGDLTRVHGLAPADFDGDGTLEIAALGTRNGSDATLVIYATTPPYAVLFEEVIGGTATGLAAGDLNEDGRVDLVISHHSAASFVTLLQMEGRTDYHRDNVTLAYDAQRVRGAPHTHGIELFDVNQDGHLDLVTAQAEWNSVIAIRGDGTGTFENRFHQWDGTGEHPYAVEIVESPTGDTFFVTPNVGGRTNGSVSILPLRRDRDGAHSMLSLGTPTSTLVCGHLDGDEHIDAVIGGHEARELSVIRKLLVSRAGPAETELGARGRTKRIQPDETIRAPAPIGAPVIADLDGDGRNEIIAPCMPRQSVYVWPQASEGENGFEAPLKLAAAGLDVQIVEVTRAEGGDLLWLGGWSESGIGMLRRQR